MDPPVLLFDGVCNFCHASVRFVIARDPRGAFRFASLQSAAGKAILERHRIPPGDVSSVVLVERGRVYRRSTAALRVARRLRAPWPLLYALVVVPRFLRDAAYAFLARHRYRWFGRKESCPLPDPGLRDRFLDGGTADPGSAPGRAAGAAPGSA